MTSKETPRQDIYSRVTNKIIADLEQGVRSWTKPWSAEHTAGRITRPLRHNGQPYSGINILMLWGSAMELDFSAPIWMTCSGAMLTTTNSPARMAMTFSKVATAMMLLTAVRVTTTR